MSLYMMSVYGDSEHARRFHDDWAKTGKKLDMGKSCVRFKKLDDLPLDVIGRAVARVNARKYIAKCEALLQQMKKSRSNARKKSADSTKGRVAKSKASTGRAGLKRAGRK